MPDIIIPIIIKFWIAGSLDATGADADVAEFAELDRGYTVGDAGGELVVFCLRLNNRLNMLLIPILLSSIST